MYKSLKVIMFCCLALLILGMPVYAATDATTATVTVTGGSLNILIPDDTITFTGITIDGKNQTLTKSLAAMDVSDFTGAGIGWNVTVLASQFKSGSLTLPYGSLKLTGIGAITNVLDTLETQKPTVQGTPPYTLDPEVGTAVTILAANEGSGMGEFTAGLDGLELSVNTSTLKASATPYSSTITYTITAGP